MMYHHNTLDEDVNNHEKQRIKYIKDISAKLLATRRELLKDCHLPNERKNEIALLLHESSDLLLMKIQ